MSETPQSAPLTDRPAIDFQGANLAVASPDSVSEACFSVPAVRALRYARPNGILVVFCSEDVAHVWKNVQEVRQIVTYPASESPRKILKLIADTRVPFDSSIAWDDCPAAQAFSRAAIPQRLGYPTAKLLKYLTHAVEVVRNIGPIEHQVNHYLLFVHKLGADPFNPVNFETVDRPPQGETFRVALVPGSDYGPACEWPMDRWVELARNLKDHCELAILPSPERAGPAKTLARELGNPDLFVGLDNDEMVDFILTCQGMVANDGSLPHIASLVGTRAMVFFGPNEPEWKRPLGRMHRIVRRHVACSGCLLTKCSMDHRCMIEISVEDALEEIRKLFNP